MSKKKANRTPFYAQVLSQHVREKEERLNALHNAAERVIAKKGDTPPRKKPPASRAVLPPKKHRSDWESEN
jgi:hypothetical protein